MALLKKTGKSLKWNLTEAGSTRFKSGSSSISFFSCRHLSSDSWIWFSVAAWKFASVSANNLQSKSEVPILSQFDSEVVSSMNHSWIKWSLSNVSSSRSPRSPASSHSLIKAALTIAPVCLPSIFFFSAILPGGWTWFPVERSFLLPLCFHSWKLGLSWFGPLTVVRMEDTRRRVYWW